MVAMNARPSYALLVVSTVFPILLRPAELFTEHCCSQLNHFPKNHVTHLSLSTDVIVPTLSQDAFEERPYLI